MATNAETIRRVRYGVTPEEYEAMWLVSSGTCYACGALPTGEGVGNTLMIDHNHNTKEVRGLLCQACNVTAGYIESERSLQVLEYLYGSAS